MVRIPRNLHFGLHIGAIVHTDTAMDASDACSQRMASHRRAEELKLTEKKDLVKKSVTVEAVHKNANNGVSRHCAAS